MEQIEQKQKLFEYTVILHPSQEQREQGKESRVLVPTMPVFAFDIEDARQKAQDKLAPPLKTDLCELLVREWK